MADACKGFTIIETMVALSILVIMVLGVNATISLAMRQTTSLYYYQLALLQQHNLFEMLDINHDMLNDEILTDWNSQNARVLPNGRGEVNGVEPDYTIALYWNKNDKLL
jgi:prepilin-type N-terminal cleavage/methylation domain-containing protein